MARERDQDRNEAPGASEGSPSREGYLLWLDPMSPSRPVLRGEVERARTSDRRRFGSDEGLLCTLRALADVEATEPDAARMTDPDRALTPTAPPPTTQEEER